VPCRQEKISAAGVILAGVILAAVPVPDTTFFPPFEIGQ
jgi:hypothetical protein